MPERKGPVLSFRAEAYGRSREICYKTMHCEKTDPSTALGMTTQAASLRITINIFVPPCNIPPPFPSSCQKRDRKELSRESVNRK